MTLHSTKHTQIINKTENPFRGSTCCAAALQRAAHHMTGLGQSLRDPRLLMIGGKAQGKLPGLGCGGVCRGGAEVSSTRRWYPWVKLRRSLRVGAWNVLTLREDDHPSLLSSEFQHLNVGIVTLSEVQ